MSEHPTSAGPQGFNGDDFQVEAFVPAFNEASVVRLEDVEMVRTYRTQNSEFFLRGLRAILRARVECPSINRTIEPSEYYVNGYGDVVPEERVSAYLYDGARRSDSHDAPTQRGRPRFDPYFRFISPGVKPQRTSYQPTGSEQAYAYRPNRIRGRSYYGMQTKGIASFGIRMGQGSALVARRSGKDRLPIQKGFFIGEKAIVAAGKIGSDVTIGEGATVSVTKIGDDVGVEPDTYIKGYFLALESC